MRPLYLLPLACVTLAATPGHGQETDNTPTAVPARPTVTNPATLPPVGYLQFEQGFVQASSSPGLNHQFSLGQSTKLAIHPRILVQVQTQPFARTLLPPVTKDQGDIILAGQLLLTPPPKAAAEPAPVPAGQAAAKVVTPKAPLASITAVAIGYLGRVRSGTSPDLDIGSFSRGMLLLADGTLPGLQFQTNFVVNEQVSTDDPSRTVRRAQLGQTLSLTRQLTKKASITGELWHFTQPLLTNARNGDPVARANAVGLLFTGGYSLRNNLVFDAGFEHGLTSTSTNWQTFAGVTYLLPCRLWKDHGAKRCS